MLSRHTHFMDWIWVTKGQETMTTSRCRFWLWSVVLLCAASHVATAAHGRLTTEALRDKIRGGWAGQMIGVSYGAATEFRFKGRIIEGEIKPEPITNSINQDDLYVEMTFAQVMDTVGLDATSADYGAALASSQYMLWHANAGARRNLARGVPPPGSGHPQYNIHADDIDFQIEADFIGIMCPGMPRASNRFCDRVGHVMNHGDGVYGGMFVCGMYASAYFEKDPRKVVAAGFASLPARSGYARIIRDLLELRPASGQLARSLADAADQLGRGRLLPGWRLRAFQHRRPAQRGLRRHGPALWWRGLRSDHGYLHPLWSGFGLQSFQRRGHPRDDARLRRDPGIVPRRHPRHRRSQIRFHRLLLQ